MINVSNFGWPEYTYLVIVFVSIGIHATSHGKPMNQSYNFMLRLWLAALFGFLLTMGGFFA